MKIVAILIVALVGLFIPGPICRASTDNTLSVKEISVGVCGEIEGKAVVVYVKESDSIQKIMQFCQRESLKNTKKVNRVKTQVNTDIIELKFVIGKLEYIFDVKVVQGLQCLFHISDDGVSLLRLVDDSFTSGGDKISDKTSREAFIRFYGYILRKQVALYVDSSLIFDEFLESDSLSYSKGVNFNVTSRVFNAVVVIDGLRHSLELDSGKGCFIDFYFAKKQLIVTQYLNRETMPGLY